MDELNFDTVSAKRGSVTIDEMLADVTAYAAELGDDEEGETVAPKKTDDEHAEVDAILDELDLDEVELGESPPEDITELDESDEAAIEAAAAKSEAYEGQESTTVELPESLEDLAAPKEAKTSKKKGTPKKAAAAKEPRVRDLASLAAEHFVLYTDWAGLDLEANKSVVIANRPDQKKIAEKFDNIFLALAAGKEPSVYTMACFRYLFAHGTATQTDLVAALKASKVKNEKIAKGGNTYNDGTARSQVGQMMVLFNTLGIATRERQTLTLRSDSLLAEKLAKL
jgi:hypothetical protein